MRSLLRPLRPHLLGLRRDRATGHLYYPVDGLRLYVRFPTDAIWRHDRRRAFEKVYFRHYRPSHEDVVVDIGAGLGTEIVRLAAEAPRLRYVAVEIQPWIYECLCLTMAQLPVGFSPFGMAIGEMDEVRIAPNRSGDDVSVLHGGPVPVPALNWREFSRRHGIDRVDLLKMNVEGAEADLLDHIDLGMVKRVIVNVHDFRADRGEDEAFRTRDRVERALTNAGFVLTETAANWIFAEKA